MDFIAWDIRAALQMAKEFFGDSDIPWVSFHTFRREAGTVALKQREENESDIHEDTGSLLSAEDIETLESFDEGTSGYFGKMLRWLENFIKNGTEEGRFTEKQAHQDLLLALWYAFACNNLDDYIHYYHAAEWMKDSEKSAAGCATWYYRYSVALMYCGRRSTPEPPWNRWSTIGSTPMPTKRSSRDWTRMRTINSAPWLRQLENRLDSGEWLPHTPRRGIGGKSDCGICGSDPPHRSYISSAGSKSVFSGFPESGRNKDGCHLVLRGKQ